MTEKKLVNFQAPEATVEKAKAELEHGEMSDRLRETLSAIAHGTDVAEQTRVKDRLQEAREEKRELDDEIERKRREREEVNREIERLEERLDALMEKDGKYDGYLQSLDQELQEGKRLFVGHKKVKKAADLGECSQQDVLDDLRQRNPGIPEGQFTDGTATSN